MRRALYIGDQLFSISDGEIRATSLSSYLPLWSAPLHTRQTLAVEGGCILDGNALPWDRVAASGSEIYCGYTTEPPPSPPSPPSYPGSSSWSSSPCEPADWPLRNALCTSDASRRSFDVLLYSAASCCGSENCASGCNTTYDGCHVWF